MIRVLTTAALATLTLAASSMANPGGLERFGWKNRVFIVFAKPGDPARAEQRRLLADEETGLADRDMIVLDVSDAAVTPVYGRAEGLKAADLRKDAGVSDDAPFTAVLIGKDGGVKLRASNPVTAADLFGLIDAMPMRAGEIRR